MIRAVLDTNVLISGILFGGNSEAILELAYRERISVVLSPDILSELAGVLRKKFHFEESAIRGIMSYLERLSLIATDVKLHVIKNKESDNRIIECAVTGEADYIVTGDTRHLLPLREFRGIRIVTPAQFLEDVEELG